MDRPTGKAPVRGKESSSSTDSGPSRLASERAAMKDMGLLSDIPSAPDARKASKADDLSGSESSRNSGAESPKVGFGGYRKLKGVGLAAGALAGGLGLLGAAMAMTLGMMPSDSNRCREAATSVISGHFRRLLDQCGSQNFSFWDGKPIKDAECFSTILRTNISCPKDAKLTYTRSCERRGIEIHSGFISR